MGITFKSAPEFASIEAFVDFLIEDDRDQFTHEELRSLAYRLQMSGSKVRPLLEAYGLQLAHREIGRHVRGFSTSNHDRWYGPGSSPTYGGAGISTTTGTACPGQRGSMMMLTALKSDIE